MSIYEGMTTEVDSCIEYDRMLRESMFVAIEEGEKVVAHSICVRLPNSSKMVDYLASTTKDLEKYRASVSFKPVILPVMQPKKAEKKVAKHEGSTKPHKKNIFPPKEEETNKSHTTPPPPPVPKRRDEDSGFSPYDNAPKHQPPAERPAPVKKNLNTPPPPPVKEKKMLQQHIQEEE